MKNNCTGFKQTRTVTGCRDTNPSLALSTIQDRCALTHAYRAWKHAFLRVIRLVLDLYVQSCLENVGDNKKHQEVPGQDRTCSVVV